MEKKYVKISTDELRNLYWCRERLNALEFSGVDNWTYYGESVYDYLSETPYDDFDEYIENEYSDGYLLKNFPEVK